MLELEQSYMEKDKKIIICTAAAKKLITQIKIKPDFVISNNYKKLLKNEKEIRRVEIYDITYNNKKKQRKVIEISDHINKTGENPLIGKKQLSSTQFFDITTLYDYKKNNITTTCLGDKYFIFLSTRKKRPPYPSTNICNIAILCKALGFSKIKGFLINNLHHR